MKINVRRNCFETNSSSMHSIVVTKDKEKYSEDELTDSIFIWDDGQMHIWDTDLEFGRFPFHILTTFKDKLMYAIASFCGGYTKEEEADANFDMLENIAKKYIPGLKSIKLPERTEPVFIKDDGAEITGSGIWEENDGEYYYHDGKIKEHVTRSDYVDIEPDYGYIDHQSMGLLQGFLKKHDISLEDFLTDKKYNVIIDGDEYCYWEELMKSSLIDKNNIDYQYPEGQSYDEEIYDETIGSIDEEEEE